MARLMTVVVVLAWTAFAGGCGFSITAPSGVTDPVEVYVIDHGIHSSVLLPREDGQLAQYSFSRFDWAVLNQDQWYRSLPALLVPGPGTLGTRDYPGPTTRDNAVQQIELHNNHPPMQALYAIRVSGQKCREVLAKLDKRWTVARDTEVLNERRGLWFVKDSAQYSLFHNCNTEVSQWMRDLGCRIGGLAVTADIAVRRAADDPAPESEAVAQETHSRDRAGGAGEP